MEDPYPTEYMTKRVDDQLEYFDRSAIKNQKAYRFLKSLSIMCNVLTTMTIALVFTVPEYAKAALSIVALILSTVVLATYQWEEFHNYGAKWEKFRLVAEQLKSEKFMYLSRSGRYAGLDDEDRNVLFVDTVEGTIRGTDLSYFSLLVEPGKRIEKRLQHPKETS